MTQLRSLLFLAALVLTLAAAAPAAAQVTLYEHPDYGGASQTFDSDVLDLSGTTIGDNRVSSVRLAPGCSLELFEHPNYRGNRLVLTESVSRLAGTRVGDDQASSLRVRCRAAAGQGVVLFEHPDFRGREAVFYQDVPDLKAERFPDNEASAVRVAPGCTVTLYEHPNYRGDSTTLYEDDAYLENDRIGDNRVSSLRVRCGGSGGPVPDRPVPPPVTPPVTSGDYRCVERNEDVSFQLDSRGNQAYLLLRGVEVARYNVSTESDGAMVLRPLGGARGDVLIVPRTREIQVRLDRTARLFCRYR